MTGSSKRHRYVSLIDVTRMSDRKRESLPCLLGLVDSGVRLREHGVSIEAQGIASCRQPEVLGNSPCLVAAGVVGDTEHYGRTRLSTAIQ
jgi:hypothetical protein